MTIEYKDSKRIVALSSDALVAHLKFNDNVTDSAGSNNGTVTGTTTYVTGKVGKGISLNGSSYVTLANESNFDFEHTNPFSITFWIKMNSGSDGGTYYVAAKQNAGGGQVGLGLLLLSNGELRFGFDTASGNHRITSSNSVVTVSSGWTHVSITYDGSSNLSGCKIYINGTLDVTGSSSSITSTVLNNYAFVWGASSDGSLDTPATYDDTRIYSRELDQNEVSVIYNGGTGTEGDLKPTDIQDNSLFVEKDTARRYWLSGSTWTRQLYFTDDFSSYADQTSANSAWVPASNVAGRRVNISDYDLDLLNDSGTTNYAVAYDLGTDISESKWTLRFSADVTLSSGSNNWCYIGLFNSDQSVGGGDSQNLCAVAFQNDGSNTKFWCLAGVGKTVNSGGSDYFNATGNGTLTSTKYYIQLRRLTATSMDMKIYTDANYSTLHDSRTMSGSAIALDDLRYIKFANNTTSGSGSITIVMDDVKFRNGADTI